MKILFTLPLIALTINSLAQIPTNGLIGDWPFNGNANDESGNGNHGIVHGATLAEDRCGNKNSAYYFDGNRQYIISKDTIKISGAMARTISVWVKWLVNDYSPEPGEHDVLGWGDLCNVGNFSWLNMHNYQGQNLPYGYIIYRGHWVGLDSPTHIDKNTWTHIVLTYDGTTLKFFINGKEDPVTSSCILKTIPTVLNIGHNTRKQCEAFEDNGGWNTAFKGWIDDIRIYNRALSPEEILSLYYSNCILEINGESEVCPGQQNVRFYIQPLDSAISYNWDYSGTGATLIDSANSVVINFTDNATNGNLSVTATFNNLVTKYKSIPITVQTVPLKAGTISGNNKVCIGQYGVTYTVPTINNATSYVWNYSSTGATIIGNSNNISVNFADDATSGNLTVAGYNKCGIGPTSEEFPINVNSLAQFPTCGLIGYWPFNGNANDESGNGNNGIVYDATLTTDRCGNKNSAYYFNGNCQYIVSKDIINISGAMPRTISVWIKWDINYNSISPGMHDILGWGNTCDIGYFNFLHVNVSPPAGGVIFHGHYNDLESSTKVETNEWAHIVFWYDGTTMKFFINGKEDPFTNNLVLRTIPTILNIGFQNYIECNPGAQWNCHDNNGWWNTAFKGSIDDIRIYNRALSSEEILSLFSDSTLVNNVPVGAGAISGNTEVCIGENGVPYTVTPINNATYYSWNYSGTGATIIGDSDSILVNFADNATNGNLTVTGFNFCGKGPQSEVFPIQVKTLPSDPGIIIGETEECKNQTGITYTIPAIDNATSYLWTYSGRGSTIYGSSNSIHIYFDDNATNGYLTVNGKNICGIGTISTEFPITVKSCENFPNILNIPNSFSPNGDGVNDFFIIRGLTANSKLVIFNRSGKKLYESVNYQNDWDGKDNDGNALDSDTYWYVIFLSGLPSELKGFVYLKR